MRSRDECIRLFQENRKLAYAALREALQMDLDRLRRSGDMGDVETSALLALWDACRFYNPSRGSFATYAYRAVVRRVRRAMVDRTRDVPAISLDEWADGRSCGVAESLVDPSPTPWESTARAVEVEQLLELLSRLPERTAQATVLWSQGWPPSAIGRELGISRQRAHQLPREGTAQLRRMVRSVGDGDL